MTTARACVRIGRPYPARSLDFAAPASYKWRAAHTPRSKEVCMAEPVMERRPAVLEDDTAVLHKLGYAQELFRSMGGFQNFAISFTIISILAGCLTSYSIAWNQGGPVAITWGWLIVGLFCTFVALALGEIASTYPTAGGLYFWSSKLGSPAWGWFTGWFTLVGQLRLRANDQQHGLRRPELDEGRVHLRLPDRAADGPVHDHGLRRVRPHERRDAAGVHGRGLGHGHVGRRVRGLRLHPARRGDLCDPGEGPLRHRDVHRPEHLEGLDGQALGRVRTLDRGRRAVLLHD